MHTRSSDENSVRLSVRLSVCQTREWNVRKRKNNLSTKGGLKRKTADFGIKSHFV